MFLRLWFPLALVGLFLVGLPAFVLFSLDLFGESGPAAAWLETKLGLSHHNSLPLWASGLLFLVPIGLLLLYFLRLKRKPHAVPSTFLWKKSIEDLHVNRLLQWLRKNVLLVLQLLVLLAAIYAVLAPRLHGTETSGKHYILMIDNSASMSATDIKPTRLAWAKAEALKEIDAASDADFGMVIVFNSTAEIRQSYTSNRATLRAAIEAIEPTTHPTQIDEALSLAASLANPLSSTEDAAVRPENQEPGKERTYAATEGIPAEIHLFSDGRFTDASNFALTNLQLTFHSPATEATGNAENVGIVRFDAVRDELDPTKLQAYVRVMNFRNQPIKVGVDLDILADGKAVQDVRHRELTIAARSFTPPQPNDSSPSNTGKDIPGEFTAKFDIPNIDENADVILKAKLTGNKDAFPLDDEASLVLGIVRKARVLIVTPGNPLLDYFFNSRATKVVADTVTIKPAELKDSRSYLEPAREGKYDLVVFDRCAPASDDEMPRSNTCFIGTPPPPWHLGGADDDFRVERVQFPQVRGWSDQDAVMRGLRGWHELEVAEAYRYKNLPPKTPRLLEGEKDMLLMFTLQRQTYKDLVLAFPLSSDDEKWNTRWFLKPLFPLFLRNLLYAMGNVRDASTEENVRPGNPKMLRPFGDVRELRVTAPSGSSTKLERGSRVEFTYSATHELGVYDATWSDQRRRFAVNLFDANESNIEPRPAVKIGDVEVQSGPARRQPRELWRWPVFFGLLFLLLEWWIYNRRVHV